MYADVAGSEPVCVPYTLYYRMLKQAASERVLLAVISTLAALSIGKEGATNIFKSDCCLNILILLALSMTKYIDFVSSYNYFARSGTYPGKAESDRYSLWHQAFSSSGYRPD